MMKILSIQALLIFIAPLAAHASPPRPWDHLGAHMTGSLIGWPTAFHGLAAASTWGLLEGGVDAAAYRQASSMDPVLNGVLFYPPLLISSVAPVLLPGSLYWLSNDPEVVGAGAAAMQAAGIAFFYNNILKALTGRLPPESGMSDPDERAHGFQFGFLRGGLFHGWPSGHMMVNSSLSASLVAYRPDLPWLRWSALAYAFAVGAAVTWGDGGDIHWLSDTVAGGLMGGAIGWTVGAGFRKGMSDDAAPKSGLSPHPTVGRSWGLLARLALP